MDYKVIAYYIIGRVTDSDYTIRKYRDFLKTLDSAGRIYISEQGVNAQFSLHQKDLQAFYDWAKTDPIHDGVDVKIHDWHEHPFAKLIVKYREQIVAMDVTVDPQDRAKHIEPSQWREFLEERDENTIVIDVRNNYESKVGYFEGAIKPDLKTFREFPAFVKELRERYDPKKTRVMMYCTGGIRCEFYSPLLKREGFENVFQLKGGVIQYGLDEGAKHWRGKLFVFDDRMVVPISSDNDETIGACLFCNEKSDTFYNCANMDCNELFVACPSCVENLKGCCCRECLDKGRVRPYIQGERPKPFRKLPHEEKCKLQMAH